MTQNELYHHGVPGMRWGVRKDRSTSGRSRSKRRKRNYSEDALEANRINKKKVYEMSNAELKKLNERRNLEQNYSRLNKGIIAKGVAFLASAAGVMNTVVNAYNNSDKLVKAGKKVVDKFIKR